MAVTLNLGGLMESDWESTLELTSLDREAMSNAFKGGFTAVYVDGVKHELKEDNYGFVEVDDE
jgi:hypothetical protein